MRPVVIPETEAADFQTSSGEARRVFIGLPATPPPPLGYPVLYLLDGNALFGTAVEAMRLQGRLPNVPAMDAPIVVGVGYPGSEPFAPARRAFDYAPTIPGRPQPDGTGGADAFLDFLTGRLRDHLAARWTIDIDRQTLFGHSFGGLFALYTLFTRSDAFGAYVAASPSIWWNDRALLDVEQAHAAGPAAGGVRPRLLVTVGTDEDRHRDSRPGPRAPVNMYAEAHALALRLSAAEKCAVTFVDFPDENHLSVIPAAVSRAVAFAGRDGRAAAAAAEPRQNDWDLSS